MKRLGLPFRPTSTDYLFVLLLMCFSGNVAFTTGPRNEPLLLLMWVSVLIRFLMKWPQRGTLALLWVILSLSLILLIQTISLEYVSLTTPLGFLVKLTIGAGVIATVRFFRLAFVRVMVWLGVLSLFFHIPTVLAGLVGIKVYEIVGPITDLVGAQPDGLNPRENILLHNFMGGEAMFRNAGIFWEPGAFSGYLVAALAFLASLRLDLPASTFRRWRNCLIVSILSTLSTTGYLFLPFALFVSRLALVEARQTILDRFLWIVVFILLLIPISGFLLELEFVGPKIETLYSRGVNMEPGWQLSRIGAVIFDWEHISQRPLFGWSQANPEFYSLFPSLDRFATGNGFSGYIREMGLAGMLIFIVSFWVGLGRIGVARWSRTLIFLIIIFQLNGESFMTYPFYLGLHFIGLERRFKTTPP